MQGKMARFMGTVHALFAGGNITKRKPDTHTSRNKLHTSAWLPQYS